MRNKGLRPYRERVVGAAEGRVLEIGAGSGLNLEHYRPAATEVLALEPNSKLSALARRRAGEAGRATTFLEASAEQIPLEDVSVDAVVMTWTLCSIPDAAQALREIRRVLKPDGRLHFVEHGLASEGGVRRWQHRLGPIWMKISGGCHLDRPIDSLIESSGFKIDRLETGYAPGPRPMTYMFEGSARRV